MSEEAQGGGAVVQITLGQVYAEVRQVHDLLNDLSGKLNPMREQLADHEKRVRALERGRWMMTGGALVLGGGVGSMVAVLLSHH